MLRLLVPEVTCRQFGEEEIFKYSGPNDASLEDPEQEYSAYDSSDNDDPDATQLEEGTGDSELQLSSSGIPLMPRLIFVPPEGARSTGAHDGDDLDFCYHCGEPLTQTTDRCPTCHKKL